MVHNIRITMYCSTFPQHSMMRMMTAMTTTTSKQRQPRRRATALSCLFALLVLASLPTPSSALIEFDLLIYLYKWMLERVFGPDCQDLPILGDTFDLDRFIASSWYTQRQQVNEFQDFSELFCVVDTYHLMTTTTTTTANAKNNNNNGTTTAQTDRDGNPKLEIVQFHNGQSRNPYVSRCSATHTKAFGGQFRTHVPFVPAFLAGPIWVIDTDYDTYAILTGGPLSVRGSCDEISELCTIPQRAEIFPSPLSFAGNKQGLWFFTRDPLPPASLLEQMEEKANAMGICTAAMLDVVHEGCTYEGANVKA
jgi:lipocalin